MINTAYKDFSVHHISAGLVNSVAALRANGGQDLHTALLIMKMFESSHPELQSELGDCYYQGDGLSENIDKALDMFKKAAQKGSLRAQYDLGWYYYDRGEYLRAIENFSVCISHKTELNDHKLSRCYACLGDAYSKISEPKTSTAIENLAIAADKYHHGFACRRLGQIYAQSGTHHFDPSKAIRYFELGASCGDSISAHELGINYILGDENLQIKPNGRKAESVLLPFADSEEYDILRDLALLYQRGDSDNGISKNYPKAKSYYERAWALQQNPFMAANLGYVYFCLDEYRNAEKMLIIADSAGYSDYSDFLGRMYREGFLGTKDLNKAAYYYGRAYNAGELNNVFTCGEFAELLEETGDYQKAYDVADKGEEKFNDIWFVFIKANLVLNGKVTNRISLDRAAEMMELCIRYNTHTEDAHMALGKYYLSVREFRKAEKHYMDAFGIGVADAAVYLGRLYEKGGGTINADINKAYEYYAKADSTGSALGKEEVSCFKKGMFGGYKRIRSL